MLFSKKKEKAHSEETKEKNISAKEKAAYVRSAVKESERKALTGELHYYRVSFHLKDGLVTKMQRAKTYKEGSKNFTLHKVFLVDASAISHDGALTVERKIAADFYDKRGSNVAILGFQRELPAWVFDSIGDDLYFVRR